MLILRWILIVLVAINYLSQLIKQIKTDEKVSELLGTITAGFIWGYVVYWLIHTVNMF